ncbi:MAG: tetratricopeptide repeat protein [Ignavibacteriales bacterium]|nr:tetratricopeptide repeat protein [Ignavibacteriales bacterium]
MKNLGAVVILCAVLVSGLLAQTKIDRAKDFLNQGKAREALALLREIVAAPEKNSEAWRLYGQAFFDLSVPDSAKIAGQKAISIDEKNVKAYILVATVEERQKDVKAALGTLNSGLVEKKNDWELLTAKGFMLLRADSVDRSIVELTKAKEANPSAATIYDGLGDAYNKQGVPMFAITQYEKSVELDSMDADVYNKLGKLYYKERRYNDAAKAYARVVVLDPSNKTVLLDLAKMYMRSYPKQYENAARYLKLYIDRFPKSDEAWGMYAEALFYLKKYPEALDAAQHVLKIDPKSGKAWRYQAIAQFELKKYKESIESFTKLQQVDTMKVEDLLRLGDANVELKQHSLALEAYESALKLDPNQKEVFNKAGALYMGESKYDKAAAMYQRRFTTDSSARALGAYVNYGNCKMILKEYDSARIAYRTFISKRADYPSAWLGLAQALMLTSPDSLQRARVAYEEWLKLIPPAEETKYKKALAEAHKNIGVAFFADKKPELAIAPLKKSLQYNDADDDTHFRLGLAYSLTNNKEETIKEYQKAFKLNPKNKDAKKGLEYLGIPVD